MREDFDKKIDQLKKEYEEKLKKAAADKRPQTKADKTLSQSGKDFADKIRKLKNNPSITHIFKANKKWNYILPEP